MAAHSDRSIPARDVVLGIVSLLVLGYGVVTANLFLGATVVLLLVALSLLYRLVVAVERIAEQVCV